MQALSAGRADPWRDCDAPFFEPSEKWRMRPSIRESLGVDLARGQPESPERPLDALHHRDRAAQVDVAVPDVGDEPLDRCGVERVAGRPVSPSDEVLDLRPAGAGQRLELVAEDDLAGVADPVEEGQVAALGGERLEQGAQRRDPDPARDQEDLRAGPPRAGQDAIRAFDEDARPDRDTLQRLRPVAELLDRDPQPRAVRRRRDREGVRSPPAVAGQEAPDEVLAGADGAAGRGRARSCRSR